MLSKIIESNKVYIIAEIGVNHNGSLELAKELIYKAHEAGVDAVKFQTFRADKLLSTSKIEKAPYQKREKSENQYQMLKRLELNYFDFDALKKICDELNIDFLSTPYDDESVKLLKDLGVDTVKVASADLVNKDLIDSILNQKLDFILSIGMASYEEISRTLEYIKKRDSNAKIALLHCTTGYPTDVIDVNMNVLKKLKREYGEYAIIGYSDHTEGVEIPIMAVALGAKIIEKHFTLDRNMDGPDHFASIEPDELKLMVKYIRNIEQAFGTDDKELTKSEKENIKVMRRSVHASKTLNEGDIIRESDISISRPYDGYSAWNYQDIIGKKILHIIDKGAPINIGDVE